MASLLIIGEIGNGKSTLVNDAFKISQDIQSETNMTCGKKDIQDNIYVYDSPPLNNIIENKNNMIQLVECLK